MCAERLLSAEIIDDERGLGELRAAWDGFAVLDSAPMAAPAWSLAWLRHIAPPGARLSIVVVHDREEPVGIVPAFLKEDRGTVACIGLGEGMLWRVTPLAEPGRHWEVAQAAWAALLDAGSAPDILRFRSSSLGSWFAPWHLAVNERPRHRRPVVRHGDLSPCPFTSLGDGFDAWFGTRSSNFRSEMRRARRRLEQSGGSIRTSSAETIEADLGAYMRLHLSRWSDGGSGFEQHREALPRMLAEIARELPPERLILHIVERRGEPIGALLLTRAGEVVSFFNSGWDRDHARLKPGLLGMLYALEQAAATGARRLDHGPGDYSYKLRFATGLDPVVRTTFLVPGRRLAGAAARQLASGLGTSARARLRARRQPRREA